jgi:septum formation protein
MPRLQLILASTSPRRRELLALLQIPFQTLDPGIEEHLEAGDRVNAPRPREQALAFAERKAAACAASHRDALVLACDTLIDLDGMVLGKPASRTHAATMLRALRGREHQVHSAVALHGENIGLRQHAVESVHVRMRVASDRELERYLLGGEWAGKAGGYAIQGEGGSLIAAIRGDYPAVVGFPLRVVARLLAPYFSLPVDIDSLYRTAPYANWMRFAGR